MASSIAAIMRSLISKNVSPHDGRKGLRKAHQCFGERMNAVIDLPTPSSVVSLSINLSSVTISI